jgi:hypothetical protein
MQSSLHGPRPGYTPWQMIGRATSLNRPASIRRRQAKPDNQTEEVMKTNTARALLSLAGMMIMIVALNSPGQGVSPGSPPMQVIQPAPSHPIPMQPLPAMPTGVPPGQPLLPGEPARPSPLAPTPVPPGQPVLPGQPALPGQIVSPTMPVQPAQISPPGQPVLPGRPVLPGAPGQSGQAVPLGSPPLPGDAGISGTNHTPVGPVAPSGLHVVSDNVGG